MKVRATLLAIPLIVGSALAQSTPPAGQAGQTGQTGQTGQVSRPGEAGQSGATGAQSGSMTSTQQTPPAEMKTMTYKGVLVDLACGSATASAAPATTTPAARTPATTPGTPATTPGTPATTPGTPATTPGTPASGASSADRASGDCAVTANSTQLGLKMDDGKVVKFDLVGNQRAQDGLKTNKGWMKNIAANKPVKVKVSGILQGDKLIASSIN